MFRFRTFYLWHLQIATWGWDEHPMFQQRVVAKLQRLMDPTNPKQLRRKRGLYNTQVRCCSDARAL